jgi:hypothetical protein
VRTRIKNAVFWAGYKVKLLFFNGIKFIEKIQPNQGLIDSASWKYFVVLLQAYLPSCLKAKYIQSAWEMIFKRTKGAAVQRKSRLIVGVSSHHQTERCAWIAKIFWGANASAFSGRRCFKDPKWGTELKRAKINWAITNFIRTPISHKLLLFLAVFDMPPLSFVHRWQCNYINAYWLNLKISSFLSFYTDVWKNSKIMKIMQPCFIVALSSRKYLIKFIKWTNT